MSNVTQINNEYTSNATVINAKASEGGVQNSMVSNSDKSVATSINVSVADSANLSVGTVICGKYSVVDKLDVTTGEADLYICVCGNEKFVVKIYRRTVSVKADVTEKLKSIKSPYVASVVDTGEVNGFPVEISLYYKNGSLQGKICSIDELKKTIIPSLNQGLKVLHDNDIIHKDLKPSNVMMLDNQDGVAIIDFGISSIREDGNTVIVTQTGFTPDYSAPETFKNLFLKDSDYYSLGITLYELFTGKLPYSKMTQQEIERYISVQRLPMPKDMPVDLKNLIRGLTYYDITNRNNKNNPNRRWGYEEVEKWLKGIPQTIPGEGLGNKNVKPFVFLGKEYNDIKELVKALAENWKDGKKCLFRGQLSDYFNPFNSEAENICILAEQEASRNSNKDDIIFWETLYKLDKECQKLYWKGICFNNLSDLGRSLLEALRKNDVNIQNVVRDMLENDILSSYLNVMQMGSEKHHSSVATLEQAYKNASNDDRQKKIILYVLGYWFSGQKVLLVEKENFSTIGELAEHMKLLQSKSFEEIQAFCHRLVVREGILDPEFEAWLLILGKKAELNQWKDYFRTFSEDETL